MSFQEQLDKMYDFHIDTEKQFLELLRIIPLDNDPKTHSPTLYNILQSACGQVENLLRLICDKIGSSYDRNNFPEYYKKLNSDGMLEMQTVILIKTGTKYKPFVIEQGFDTPFWWRGYNNTKHNLPDGLKEGNIENTINALASVYLLHCVASYSNYSTHITDKKLWYPMEPLYAFSGGLVKTSRGIPDSELFYSIFLFNEASAPIG